MDLNVEPQEVMDLNSQEEVLVDKGDDDNSIEDVVAGSDDKIAINNVEIEMQEPRPIGCSPEYVTSCKPHVGMEFDTLKSSKIYYNKYARATGFSIRIRSTQRNKAGDINSRTYVCSREGKKVKDSRQTCAKQFSDKRCDCIARMTLRLVKATGKYRVKSFEENHNHDLEGTLTTVYLRSHRKIDDIQARTIDVVVAAGLGPVSTHKYMSLQAGGSVNLGFIKEDIKSYLRKPRQKDLKLGEANSILEYFRKKKKTCPSFFYAYQLDIEGKIANIFWADLKMIVDYQAFGDMIMFDTTFGPNKASRPLGIFTGFNNHRQCAVFGACLMFDESIPSFSWVFQIFLDCHGGKFPIVIFTDQDAAMMNALELVMPTVRHCLCSWHIIHNATTKLRGTLGANCNNFVSDLKICIYANCNVANFEKMCNDMEKKYSCNMVVNKWMHKLYGRKEKWSVAYRTNIFSAGVLSTQLVECTNGRIKRELGSGITMRKFFNGFDSFLDRVRETEKKSGCNFRQSFPHLSIQNAGILKHAAQIYTPGIFARFSEQFDKMHDIFLDEMNLIQGPHVRNANDGRQKFKINYDPSTQTILCSCHMFEMCGYLCAHILRVFDVCRILEIPKKYIMNRWTRFAMSGLTVVDSPCPKLSDMESIAMVSSNFHRLIHRTGGKSVYIDRIMKFMAQEHEFINKCETSEGNGNDIIGVSSVEPIDVAVTGLKIKENPKCGWRFKRNLSCLEKPHGSKSTKNKKKNAYTQPSSQITNGPSQNEYGDNLQLGL